MLNLSLVSRKCPVARWIDALVLVCLVVLIGCTLMRAGQQYRSEIPAADAVQANR